MQEMYLTCVSLATPARQWIFSCAFLQEEPCMANFLCHVEHQTCDAKLAKSLP